MHPRCTLPISEKGMVVAKETDVLRAIERAPLRTVRLKALDEFGPTIWRILDRLTEQGAVKRLTHGIYTVPPDGQDARRWKPPIEEAGIAVAVARFGARQAAMTDITAARHWAAVPRAVGTATIAVPRAGYAPVILDDGGTVRFIPRKLDELDLVLEQIGPGNALVTTPAQTLFDLLMKPGRADMHDEAIHAAENLRPRVKATDLQDIVDRARRVNDRVRTALIELRERDGGLG